MTSLSEYVAAALDARAPALAAHWQTRARAATPRQGAAASEAPGAPTDVVRALAAGLTMDAWPVGEVMRQGWAAGMAAHADGVAVPHVQRDADLLLAVVLAESERLCADAPVPVDAGGAFGLARRLQRLTAGYAQAGVAGFLHAQRAELRAQWRTLRHDLRNPIGTIQSALALMDDEALPLESRQGPRMRAMVARNAGTLATLVTQGLDDRTATALLGAAQAVSLRDVAHAARREVREAAWLADCVVEVDAVPDAPLASIEPATMELALTALLLAGLAHAAPGAVLRVERAPGADPLVLRVAHAAPAGDAAATTTSAPPTEGPRWDESGLALAATLMGELGGTLSDVATPRPRVPAPAALVGAPALHLMLPSRAARDGDDA